jgi:hypothetical protein
MRALPSLRSRLRMLIGVLADFLLFLTGFCHDVTL